MDEPVSRLNAALEGRYRVERELGEGGMATVYLAEDLKHHRNVALKVLKPELAAVVGAERFLAEIEVTAGLQHPHILPLFDSGEADGFLFYVMPYVEGESLRERLERERQLPVDEALRIATALANALDHAHRKGVIHRDIKPANILMQDGEPVVADFGIALAVGAAGGARLTETGLSVGTPYYMSPEQATGDQNVGPASDTYALACVLYEMLVGEPPYLGNTAQAVLGKIIAGTPVAPTEARPSIPAHVDAAIRKALEKLPADRFTGAHEFAKALADPGFSYGNATAPGDPTPTEAGPWKARALALLAVALLSTGVAAWALARPAPEAGVLRYDMQVSMEVGLVNDFGPNLAISRDGTRLVYAAGSEGGSALYVRDRHDLEARLIAGTEGGHQPFFSPSGMRLGFITEDRQVRVASLGGEPPVTLVSEGLVRGGGAWGDDDFIYFSKGGSGEGAPGLRRVPAGGGPVEVVTAVDSARGEIRHYFPDVLPGARGVLFSIVRERLYDPELMDVGVVDLETGEHRLLLQAIFARWSPSGHVLAVRRDGALLAAPFDLGALELTGPATPLLEGVGVEALATADLAVSRTGTLVYATGSISSAPDRMVWVDREGRITEVEQGWAGTFGYPALSPDGTRLALSIVQPPDEDIWVKRLDGGPLTKLSFSGGITYRPTWRPDGVAVAYVSGPDAFIRLADGRAGALPLIDLDESVYELAFTPDGRGLVYRVGDPGDLHARWTPDDSVGMPLLASDFDEGQPAISPDGRWLAYTSDESGRSEVYVRPIPDTDAGRWQVSLGGGTEPRWAHSGEELFYRNAAQDFVAVEIVAGETFITGDQTVLFSAQSFRNSPDHQFYDVAPDDQRFVMVRRTGTEAEERLIVVENFTEEILRRSGGR